jgi:hypothetical protein
LEIIEAPPSSEISPPEMAEIVVISVMVFVVRDGASGFFLQDDITMRIKITLNILTVFFMGFIKIVVEILR